MNAARAGSHRTLFVRLVLLAGLLIALLVAFGGQPFRLGTRPIATAGGQGYWLLAKDGGVFGYGDAVHRGTNLNSGNDAVGLAPTPTMGGYWIADDDGTVFAYGDAHDYGSRFSSVDDVRGFAARSQGDGYWLVTRDGAVYAFGAAPYRGNTPALGTNQKIVGMTSTPSGNGYWLVGRDGGIFAFGDAAFHGSTGAMTLNRPIVGMARTPSGNGYWFVASDGGVFAFGGAGFHGNAIGSAPAGSVVGITPTASGNGYWLVASNGKVFPFGDAANYGDASGLTLRQPIAGIAATPVVHTNSVPAPVGDSASVAEDGSTSVNVTANDAGLGDGPIAVEITGGPAHGSASVGSDKKISYTPAANYNGADSITYKVTDGDGESATAVLSLAVTAVNDAPAVQNRSLGTNEDAAAGGTFSGSDTDGNSLTYSVVGPPAHGSVEVSGSSYTYTPAADYNGADSFTYRANDGSANSNTGTVSVTVDPVADTPLASNLSVSTDEDVPLSGSLSGSDVDGDVVTYAVVGQSANGDVSLVDGEYTYTPDADYNGSDSFTYTASDGTLTSEPATVSITVTAVNDAPFLDQTGPLAASVDEDDATGVDVTPVTASDVDTGDTLTWSASDPDHGTVTGGGSTGEFTYVPDADFDGTESFTITVSDGHGGEDTIDVAVTITDLNNDPPTASAIGSQSTDEDTPLAIPFTVGDPDTGDVLTITVGSSDPTLLPSGSLVLSGTGSDRTLTVTPAANLFGEVHLFLMVSDGEAAPILQDILLTVESVNDLPVANAGGLTTDEDTPGSGALTGNDPIEGSALTFSLVGDDGGAEHGTVTITNAATGAYTYEPDEDWNGSDSFQFVANDGDDSDPATISVTVDPVDDAPAFDGTGNTGSGDEETLISGTVVATDPDAGDSLTYSIESGDGAAHGSADVDEDTGEWSYTGEDDFAGLDSFTITVTDGGSLTDTISVGVTVGDVNDAPAFATASVSDSGDEDTAITGTVTATDPDAGDTLSYSIADGDGPADGQADVDETTGVWSYTGGANFNGTDSFTITVTDGDDETDTIVVNLTVGPVNDAPEFYGTGDSGAGDEEALMAGTVSASDVEDDELSYSIESGDGAHDGTATVDEETGAWSYTGSLNFFGSDSFTITVSDGNGGADTIEVNVSVANVNDAPVVSTIGNQSTNEDTPLTVPFTVNDADPGDTLSVTVGSSNPTLLPAGALSLGGAGANRTLTVTTPLNLNGTAQVFLSITDGHAAPVIQDILLTVNPVNDAPVITQGAGPLPLSVNEDDGNGEQVTVSATDIENDSLTWSANDPAHGTVTNVAGVFTYTPDANFDGSESFTITANDGHGGTDTIQVNVTIDPSTDAPAFATASVIATGDEETAITGSVTATDPDTGDTLTYSIESGDEATDGTANVNPASGAWGYTGNLDFAGSDSFTITVGDGNGGSDTIQVNVTVNNLNDNPTASNITISGPALTGINGTIVASDPDGDTVTFTIEPGDEPGVPNLAVVYPNGDVTFTGMLGFITDSFIVTLSDGNGGTSQVTVTVNEVLGL